MSDMSGCDGGYDDGSWGSEPVSDTGSYVPEDTPAVPDDSVAGGDLASEPTYTAPLEEAPADLGAADATPAPDYGTPDDLGHVGAASEPPAPVDTPPDDGTVGFDAPDAPPAPVDVIGSEAPSDLATDSTTLTGLPPDGQGAAGDWWHAAAPPASCCVVPDAPGLEAAPTGLSYVDASGQSHELAGVDTTATGQADMATLDANGDGVPDTWMFDTTGTGSADLMYYDSTGTGTADSVCCDPAGSGEWTAPQPIAAALAAQPSGTGAAAPSSAGDVTLLPGGGAIVNAGYSYGGIDATPTAAQVGTVAELYQQYRNQPSPFLTDPFGDIWSILLNGPKSGGGGTTYTGGPTLADAMSHMDAAGMNAVDWQPGGHWGVDPSTGSPAHYRDGELTPSPPSSTSPDD